MSSSAKMRVFGLLVIASLFIPAAFALTVGGMTFSEIQLQYFTLPRIVNYLIFGVVIFIGAMLWPATKDWVNANNKAMFGTAIVIILLLAGFATTSIITDPTHYVWQESWYIKSKMVLVGDKNCVYDINKELVDTTQETTDYYSTDSSILRSEWKVGGKNLNPLLLVMDSNQEKATKYQKRLTDLRKELSVTTDYCYTQDSVRTGGYITPTTVSNEQIAGWGILRGTRLFVLIGTFILLSLALRLLAPDLDENTNTTESKYFKARYILSGLLAMQIANSGTTKGQFLQIAYWAFLLLLFKMFKYGKEMVSKGEGEHKKGNMFPLALSYGIVNTVANMLYAHYGVGLRFIIPFGTLGMAPARPDEFLANFMTGLIVGFAWDIIAKVTNLHDLSKAKGILGKWWKNHKKEAEKISDKYDKLEKLKEGFNKLPKTWTKLKEYYHEAEELIHHFDGTDKQKEEIHKLFVEIEELEHKLEQYLEKALGYMGAEPEEEEEPHEQENPAPEQPAHDEPEEHNH